MPTDLLPEERQIWRQIVPVLDETGLLAASDGMTVRLAIRHYLVAMKASDELLESDTVALDDDHNGLRKKHPSSTIMAQHSAAYAVLAKELGLTFASRARTAAPRQKPEASDNPFDSSTGS